MVKKMSEEDVDKAIKNVEATLYFEGFKPSQESKEIGRKMLKDEISSKKAIEMLKAKYQR